MNPDAESARRIEQAAAQWMARLDRGLTAEEQDEYSRWMALDARHREAVGAHRWSWDELDRLAGLHTTPHAHLDPDLLAPKRLQRFPRRVRWFAPASLAAAAVIAVLLALRPNRSSIKETPAAPIPSGSALTAPCERRALPDGSVADLNRGAAIDVVFSDEFRRIRLLRGEAKFSVTKNRARPFIVEAGGVEVQAVGTVFDVALSASKVDVVVTEGTVKLKDPGHPYVTTPLVHAGQAASAARDSAALPSVETLSESGLSARVAWQPTMLHFDDLPLSDIVAAFNAHNTVKLRIGDDALAPQRLSAAFRSDNVEGFVRLMVFDFGMHADHPSEQEIVLRKSD
ncbi:MAG TPA: FecR domain-containing protein [Opitutaceae bacterium]